MKPKTNFDKTVIRQDTIKTILELAQEWRTGSIDSNGFAVFNSWYYSLEGVPFEYIDEFTVEKLEKRLHQQFYKPPINKENKELSPPWDSLRNKE